VNATPLVPGLDLAVILSTLGKNKTFDEREVLKVLLCAEDSSFDPKAGKFVVLVLDLVIRPRVGEGVDLVGLEVAQDLRVNELVLEPWPLLHDRIDCVDLTPKS